MAPHVFICFGVWVGGGVIYAVCTYFILYKKLFIYYTVLCTQYIYNNIYTALLYTVYRYIVIIYPCRTCTIRCHNTGICNLQIETISCGCASCAVQCSAQYAVLYSKVRSKYRMGTVRYNIIQHSNTTYRC